MGTPRIGRPDLRGARDPIDPLRGRLTAPSDALRRFLEAPAVMAQLEALPAALSDVAARLRPLARHEKDLEALARLDAVQERAWALWLALARAADEESSLVPRRGRAPLVANNSRAITR